MAEQAKVSSGAQETPKTKTATKTIIIVVVVVLVLVGLCCLGVTIFGKVGTEILESEEFTSAALEACNTTCESDTTMTQDEIDMCKSTCEATFGSGSSTEIFEDF